MSGEEPINGHVFRTERYRRLLLRRWRWVCSCGVSESGFRTQTSAVYAGDNHAMKAN